MMTIGETRSLTTHLATMRPDWPQTQILHQVNKLAEDGYSVVDLTAACAEVAATKQYGVAILGIVVPERILERHQAGQQPRRRHRYRPDDAKICDVCTKPERVCQSTAANAGELHDHEFVSIEEADADRAARRNAATVLNAAAVIANADLFNSPDDL